MTTKGNQMSETKATYVLRQLDDNNNPIEPKGSEILYFNYEDAIRTAWYLYRKFEQVYGIKGSDGTFRVLEPESI
jgi:hypothetical protein